MSRARQIGVDQARHFGCDTFWIMQGCKTQGMVLQHSDLCLSMVILLFKFMLIHPQAETPSARVRTFILFLNVSHLTKLDPPLLQFVMNNPSSLYVLLSVSFLVLLQTHDLMEVIFPPITCFGSVLGHKGFHPCRVLHGAQ